VYLSTLQSVIVTYVIRLDKTETSVRKALELPICTCPLAHEVIHHFLYTLKLSTAHFQEVLLTTKIQLIQQIYTSSLKQASLVLRP
jgi:hypothetical protein